MRRFWKILLYVSAGLAAAASSALAVWIAVAIWVSQGETHYSDADVRNLAQMFVEATTLPDGRRVFLGSDAGGHDLHFVQRGIDMGLRDHAAARWSTLAVWYELGDFGLVPNISIAITDEKKGYLVGFVDAAGTIPKRMATDGETARIERERCRIDLSYAPQAGLILDAETVVIVGSLSPGWFRAAQPCLARGLFATVGLVGDSCAVRPSVLCPLDDEWRGTPADFVVLQALQRVRREQHGAARAGTDDPVQLVRRVLASEPENAPLVNLRRPRAQRFLEQFEQGWYFMTASDEQLGNIPRSIRWRWILNLRAM